MIVNLAFIKAANGLFYFALDYIAALESSTSIILVRSPLLAQAVERRFPKIPVRVVSGFGAAVSAWAAAGRGEVVFTPSSHPIPCCNRQLVVLHDSYPFQKPRGRIKATLFFLSMRTSRATAGYINQSDALVFLLSGGLDPARTLSTPNRMKQAAGARSSGSLTIGDGPVIGLFGTDSPKKNYEVLFAALASRPFGDRLALRLYGQANDYISDIIAAFPALDIRVVDSGNVELEDFVRTLDLVAAAATHEGFSRPIALALSLGTPCWIVEAPVFREFYGEAAMFHTDIDALADALTALHAGMTLERPNFSLSERLDHDFWQCINWLKSQDRK